MNGAIDRKFNIFAINPSTGKTYTDQDALLLCAKDAAVPAALIAYRDKCAVLGANQEHIDSVQLLIGRVVDFQDRQGGGRIPDTVGAEIARCLQGKAQDFTGHEDFIWEPVEDLMVQALDSDCEPMKPEGDLEPGEEQRYSSTAIGHDLDDPEGCHSYIDIITGKGREADETLARFIVAGLQLFYMVTNSKQIAKEEKRPEGCPGDCLNHHGLCVGDEGEA